MSRAAYHRKGDTKAMKHIDINCDCGESFGNWVMGNDSELILRVSTANIACGFHAGDPITMERTIQMAKRAGAVIGAHPGLPDLLGFGRRRMAVTPEEAYSYVLYQAGALAAMLEAHGMTLHHVKPHGVLYNMLNEDADLAGAVVRAVVEICPEPCVYWPAPIDGRALPEAARAAGVKVVSEVNFDLEYDREGNLQLQRKKTAVDLEKLRRNLDSFLSSGEVAAITGERVRIEAQSISVHGDGPDALCVTDTIREVLMDRGWQVMAA